MVSKLVILFLLFLSASCATYQDKVKSARELIEKGDYAKALEELEKLADKDGRDQLAYLLDYSSALEFAGKWKESTDEFARAEKLVELNDYHSVTNIAASALTSEEMIQYKGESFEKILINVFASLGYLLQGKPDDAVVEARRINEKVLVYRQKDRPNYEQNPFGSYLSGLIWESEGKFDDAYIAYEDSQKLGSHHAFIGGDLVRLAKKARREDAYHQWKKAYPSVVEDPKWYAKNTGEVVLVFLQGWGPRKIPAPSGYNPAFNSSIPILKRTPSITQSARLELASDVAGTKSDEFRSQVVYDLESAAIKTLDADHNWLIARRVGGAVTKAVVADQIRQKNELLGLAAFITMSATDRADLRQWSILPQTIQLARAWLPAGKYKASALGLSASGANDGEQLPEQTIQVQAGRKTFLVWKSLR